MYEPTPGQRPAMLCQDPVVVLMGKRAAGKTALGCAKIAERVRYGLTTAVIAPTFRQLTQATFPELLHWLPMDRCVNAHLNHPFTLAKYLTFLVRKELVKLFYGSAEHPMTWAGVDLNCCFIDDTELVNEDVYYTIQNHLRKGPAPQLILAANPDHLASWLPKPQPGVSYFRLSGGVEWAE